MIIAILLVLGLCLGSFVNALVWRVHEQAEQGDKKKPDKTYLRELSISKGRSMCPDCRHTLMAKDLIPVFSWLSVAGKCRYCQKPISWQYPVVELITPALFILSYLYWPVAFSPSQIAVFVCWLLLLVGFMALIVYDARWMILPNRIVYPLMVIAIVSASVSVAYAKQPRTALAHTILSMAVGGGIFYVLFQVSRGRWIGGGDVRLGWLYGLVLGAPEYSLMVLFLASLLGCMVALPLMASRKLRGSSLITFGPFLIVATILVRLFGHSALLWYQRALGLA